MSEFLSQHEWQKLIRQMNSSREALAKIVNPILKKHDLERKEILEVCQIGKFVLKVDSSIEIIDKTDPPSPDFLILHKGNLVGLEHTRITTPNATEIFKLETLINLAEQIYVNHYNENVHANIGFKNDDFKYTTKAKAQLAQEIASLVRLDFLSKPYKLPHYLSKIRTTVHSKVTFTLYENKSGNYYLTKDKLEKEVKKKEGKIKGYRNSDYNLTEFWLVLLIGSSSAASYEFDTRIDYRLESEFNRVYLVEDFNSKVHRIR